MTAEIDGHTIGLSIYDLRFPELYRLLALSGAECCSSGHSRCSGKDHWRPLRAGVENQTWSSPGQFSAHKPNAVLRPQPDYRSWGTVVPTPQR